MTLTLLILLIRLVFLREMVTLLIPVGHQSYGSTISEKSFDM